MLCGVKSLHTYIHNKFVLCSNDNKGTKMFTLSRLKEVKCTFLCADI